MMIYTFHSVVPFGSFQKKVGSSSQFRCKATSPPHWSDVWLRSANLKLQRSGFGLLPYDPTSSDGGFAEQRFRLKGPLLTNAVFSAGSEQSTSFEKDTPLRKLLEKNRHRHFRLLHSRFYIQFPKCKTMSLLNHIKSSPLKWNISLADLKTPGEGSHLIKVIITQYTSSDRHTWNRNKHKTSTSKTLEPTCVE